jgi:hypothetical protein
MENLEAEKTSWASTSVGGGGAERKYHHRDRTIDHAGLLLDIKLCPLSYFRKKPNMATCALTKRQ